MVPHVCLLLGCIMIGPPSVSRKFVYLFTALPYNQPKEKPLWISTLSGSWTQPILTRLWFLSSFEWYPTHCTIGGQKSKMSGETSTCFGTNAGRQKHVTSWLESSASQCGLPALSQHDLVALSYNTWLSHFLTAPHAFCTLFSSFSFLYFLIRCLRKHWS